jgi:hypothetical protein
VGSRLRRCGRGVAGDPQRHEGNEDGKEVKTRDIVSVSSFP